MEWKIAAEAVGKIAPALGTLLGGPAGGAIGGMIADALGTENSPDAIALALQHSPDAAIKLRELDNDRAKHFQDLLISQAQAELLAETQRIQAVNTTMQAETQAEHWPSYSWRPFCGFVFGAMFFGVYFLLPLLGKPVPVVPTEAWMAMGAVLGVASWFRGKMQADPSIATDNRG